MAACARTPPDDTSQPVDGAPQNADDAGQPDPTLPDDIVRALGTDAGVLSCAEGVRGGRSAFEPDWVSARRIDLNHDGRRDWIVEGRHPCLRDGESTDWWVYADQAAGRRLLLAVDDIRTLQVAASQTQGFRDLRLQRADGTVTARYDGSVYRTPTDADAGSAPSPRTAASDDAGIDTVAGRLQIIALPPRDDGREAFVVQLDGEQLLRTGPSSRFSTFPVPRVLQRYADGIAPYAEVVVFQQHMRGNACNGGPLWILGLHRDGRHALSAPIDFCGGRDPQLAATREQLTITLPGGPMNRGDGTIPTEVWVYRDGEVMRAGAATQP